MTMLEYYGRRAREYDRIYTRPERQADLALLVDAVQEAVAGRAVVEIVCGTGWWTQKMAGHAASIVATDGSPEVLDVARARGLPVEFREADAFRPDGIEGAFDTLVAGFWMSHVPRADVSGFLADWHARLGAARVVLFDNRYVEGRSSPVSRTDAAGDTYQRRRLDDGSEYEVRKNFPTADEIRSWVPGVNVIVQELEHYWLAVYDVES
ncbi:MAG: class I SAM-dependent methyltransferase [Gemmatimonadetes bacterium]|nr:class I SAM-dependent methyltransferase [Gemmatimonadota bacterium]